jgi:mRNA interferase RelE/StbE
MAPQTVREKVVKALVALSGNPRPHGVEKLSQDPRLWRVRCGEYRIIYWINDEAGILVAPIVRHRKDAYRDIDKLDPALVVHTPLRSGCRSRPERYETARPQAGGFSFHAPGTNYHFFPKPLFSPETEC